MSTYYLDTSAAVKLVREEDHSAALASFYDDATAHAATWISSVLLRIELVRTTKRTFPRLLDTSLSLLDTLELLSIDAGIVEAAVAAPDPMLRSLDAIHLASARLLGPELDGVISYDRRLIGAVRRAGLPVVTPR